MPKGDLTCNCGKKSAVHAFVQGKRVGYICEPCARDDYALRSFLVAAGWLYGWRMLRFTYVNAAATSGELRLAIMSAVDEEESRAYECQELRKSRQLAWAVGDSRGLRY
jgi:hypothetical protein